MRSLIAYRFITATASTVLLINDDRVIDLMHFNVFKFNIWNSAWFRGTLSLDSNTVLSPYEAAVGYSQTSNRAAWHASYTDSMARPAVNMIHGNVARFRKEWYAVISCGYYWIVYLDVAWVTDFDSVGVGAFGRSTYVNVADYQIKTYVKVDVCVLAVEGSYVVDLRITGKVELQGLKPRATQLACMPIIWRILILFKLVQRADRSGSTSSPFIGLVFMHGFSFSC